MTEVGVGLCCEAAARLVLESEAPARFVVEEADSNSFDCEETQDASSDDNAITDQESETDETQQVLFQARDTAFAILQNRTVPIWSRLRHFLLYIEELQEALDFENLDEIEESADYHRTAVFDGSQEVRSISAEDRIASYKKILEYCRKLEPIDESWPKRLDDLEHMLRTPAEFCQKETEMCNVLNEREYEYEHLAVYFVFRYFMKCRIDSDVYSRGCLAVFCIILIRLLDCAKYMEYGELSKEDRVQNAKDCSKEIEYSEENLAILADLFWEHGFEKIIEAF